MSNLFDMIYSLLHGKPTPVITPINNAPSPYIKLNPIVVAPSVNTVPLFPGITANTLRMIAPKLNPKDAIIYADSITKHMSDYNVTQNELPMFLCQALVESQYFTKLEENLHYLTVRALQGAWPSRFGDAKFAAQYLGNPQKLANFVYANRYGNGDTASGDGWLYRGRGLFMYTFKSNYQELANHLGMSLADTIAYITTIDGAVLSALYFWKQRKLNRFTTRDQVDDCTKIINGGLNGLDARLGAFDSISNQNQNIS